MPFGAEYSSIISEESGFPLSPSVCSWNSLPNSYGRHLDVDLLKVCEKMYITVVDYN